MMKLPPLHSFQASPIPSFSESLLVFSDVHLGSDLNDCTGNVAHRSATIDRDLILLLDHYRREKPKGDRWRIVIAGDFIDFIGMTIAPTEAGLDTQPNEEEREHGLGNAADHARVKMRLVAARHADVFEELARFVADGHALTLVHGNHDIEFHWDVVKEDFRNVLLKHAHAMNANLNVAAFSDRIEFRPWFFYRDGVAYIEHGHQYDPFCSTEHVMAPTAPLDPRRIARGLTDVLLRFVVRPTHGMKEHGHENAGVLDYLAFAARLGVLGLFGLGARFASAVVELFRVRSAHLSEAGKALRAEHDRRVAALADATRLGVDRLRALLSLQVQPVTRTIHGILASVLLDRLALAATAMAAFAALAIFGAPHGHTRSTALVVLALWGLVHVYLSRQRQIDPADRLVAKASQLSKLFPAAFVVMGHTHIPVQADAGTATYVNLGSWAEEAETPDGTSGVRATRTHLVIHVHDTGPEAQLFAWESGVGPRRFVVSSRG